jgi:hypothetical protein
MAPLKITARMPEMGQVVNARAVLLSLTDAIRAVPTKTVSPFILLSHPLILHPGKV